MYSTNTKIGHQYLLDGTSLKLQINQKPDLSIELQKTRLRNYKRKKISKLHKSVEIT